LRHRRIYGRYGARIKYAPKAFDIRWPQLANLHARSGQSRRQAIQTRPYLIEVPHSVRADRGDLDAHFSGFTHELALLEELKGVANGSPGNPEPLGKCRLPDPLAGRQLAVHDLFD
jgi:hypothetical protein